MRIVKKINRVEQEGQEVLQRACKMANISPTASNAQLVAALEKYVERLHQLAAEMADKFPGEEGKQAQVFIDIELGKTIRKIAHMRIKDLKPV